MCKNILVLVCLVAFGSSASAAIAPFITKCISSDSKCAKSSAQAAIPKFAVGIPELGVDKMDPLHYAHIDASSNNLKLILNDINITGLKNCHITKIIRDVAKSKIFIGGVCNLALEGDYEIDGRLLVLSIKGKGKIHAKLNKIVVEVEADMGEKVKDGKKYWDIKSWRHTYELQDKSELVLENLFDGNEVLGTAARDLLKNNANDVIGEVAPPIIKAVLTKVVKIVDKFFHKVPAEELALD